LVDLSNGVRAALERIASGTYGGIQVQSIVYDSAHEMYNDNVDLDGVFGWQQDYIFRIKN
jgi:hypothetical protein